MTSPESFGAVGDAVSVTSAVTITTGTKNLTVAGAAFTAADVGKSIVIKGAGAANIPLSSVIDTFTDATHVVIHDNAASTLTASTRQVVYGHDDTAAFIAAAAAMQAGTTKSFAHSPAATGYLIIPTDASRAAHGSVFALSSVSGLAYDALGVPIYLGFPTAAYFFLFDMAGCVAIDIRGLAGVAMHGKGSVGAGGVNWIMARSACRMISVTGTDVNGGVTMFSVNRTPGDTAYGYGFTFTGQCVDCAYGIGAGWDGGGMRFAIKTQNADRSFIGYNWPHGTIEGSIVSDAAVSQDVLINANGHSTDISQSRSVGFHIKYHNTNYPSGHYGTCAITHTQADPVVSDIATTIIGTFEVDIDYGSTPVNARAFQSAAYKGKEGALVPGDAGNICNITILGQVRGRVNVFNPILSLNASADGFDGSTKSQFVFNLDIPDETTQAILVGPRVAVSGVIRAPLLPKPTYQVPINGFAQAYTGRFVTTGALGSENFTGPARFFDPMSTAITTVALFDQGAAVWADVSGYGGQAYADTSAMRFYGLGTRAINFQTGGGATDCWNMLNATGEFQPAVDNARAIGDSAHRVSAVHSMADKLYGSSSGVVTVQAAATAGTPTITLPASTGTLALAGSNADITTMSAVTTVSSAVSFTNSTAATSPITGAIKATGGIASQGTVVAGGGVCATGGLGAGPIAANRTAIDNQGSGYGRLLSYGSDNSTPGRLVFHQSSADNSVYRDAFYVHPDGGLVVGSPTGGSKGAGKINAVEVFADGSLLNCMAIELIQDGAVNLAKWDSLAPSGRHDLAHRFQAMLDEGFDPRDPAQYIARLRRDRALPGMPRETEWQHGTMSLSELHNRLWLAVEMLAAAFISERENVQARLHALEVRLTQ